ncbi:HU family DNA-binding protein [Aquella oligotrophica]|nr:HU family DNA-binding protein [Aquella oligotrophica]
MLLFERNTMNKAELIDAIAAKADISKVKAGEALDAFMDSITAALKADDKVTLVGFGTFSVAERAARTGRNPKTGEELKIAASKAPKFSAGATLKEAVAPAAKAKKAK